MNDDFYNVTFYKALGNAHLILLAILTLVILVSVALIGTRAHLRRQVSAALAALGVAVYFYAGALEDLGLARTHMTNLLSGDSDPFEKEYGFASLHIRLWVFRSLSVATLAVSTIGFACSVRATKPNPKDS